jgi:hypothetical protein
LQAGPPVGVGVLVGSDPVPCVVTVTVGVVDPGVIVATPGEGVRIGVGVSSPMKILSLLLLSPQPTIGSVTANASRLEITADLVSIDLPFSIDPPSVSESQ